MRNEVQAARMTCAEVAADLFLSQPELLPAEKADGKPAHARGKGVYNGRRSAVDEMTRLKVGAMRLLGASDREIEETCHVDHRSIPALLASLEKTGQLPALKERVTLIVGDNAEQSGLLLRRLIAKGMDGEVTMELASMLKAAGAVNNFQVEQFELLNGRATQILEQRAGGGRAEFEAFMRQSGQVIDVASTANDSEASAGPQISAGNVGVSTDGHEPDTTAAVPSAASAATRSDAAPPGGGSAPAPDRKTSMV